MLLSSLSISLVLDAVSDKVVNQLMYADGTCLLASSVKGLQSLYI